MPGTKLGSEQLDRLIGLSPAVHYIAKPSGDYGATFISDGIRAQLGYEPAQFTQNPEFWASRIHPDDLSRVMVNLQKLFENDRYEHEYRFLHADGSWRWMHDQLALIRNEDGNPLEIVGSWLDITERVHAEEQLRLSEARYKEAQQTAAIGNWDRDIVNNESWWSDELYSMLALDPMAQKPSFETFLERVVPHERQRVRDNLEQTLANGGSYAIDVPIVLPDGTERILRSQGAIRFDADSRPVRISGTLQDVTERIRLEREIVAASDQERARIMLELHDDLGQELTVISWGLMNLAKQLARDGSQHEQNARRLISMIQESISDTFRVSQSLSPSFWSTLGVKEALRALANEVNEHTDAVCRVEFSDDQEFYDEEVAAHMYRVAQESINSALKYGNAQNIELRCEHDGSSLCLEVLDDGTSIPPERDGIEALGLRTMRYRADMLHGRLDVTRRTSGGTRVLWACPF